MIINDIENNRNKYILVSPYGRGDDVVPHFFRGREIIDIRPPLKPAEINSLRAKLTDIQIYEFSDIGTRKQVEVASAPRPLQIAVERSEINIAIQNLKVQYTQGQRLGDKQVYAEYKIQASIQNSGNAPVSDLTMVVHIPNRLVNQFTYDELKGYDVYEEEGYHLFSYGIAKLSPKQSYAGKPINVKITNYNDEVERTLAQPIIVRVYTDEAPIEKDFPLEDTLYYAVNDYQHRPLKAADFASRKDRW